MDGQEPPHGLGQSKLGCHRGTTGEGHAQAQGQGQECCHTVFHSSLNTHLQSISPELRNVPGVGDTEGQTDEGPAPPDAPISFVLTDDAGTSE